MSAEQPLPQPEVRSLHTATGSVDPQSVEGLFLAALAKPDPDQRRAFLDEACLDEEQRRRVEALLRAYDDAGSFLEKPAVGRDGVPGGLDAPPRDEVPLNFLSPSDLPGCLGTLGPYQILETIGRGGMGIVLRGLDTKLKPDVAEDELLKAGDAKSVSSLFSEPQIGPGGMFFPPPPDWNLLFVPGDPPKTWRLDVPKSVATSPKADAAATGGLLPDSPSDDEIRKN